SGTLPDIADKYIVLTAIVASNPEQLLTILPKFRQKTPEKGLRKKEKAIKEFKFHFVGDITREKVLSEIISKDIRIYTLVIDKMGGKIADTPENYAKLIKALLDLLKDEEKAKHVYIDKHFDKPEKLTKLQTSLEEYAKKRFIIKHVDSFTDSRIDLAD